MILVDDVEEWEANTPPPAATSHSLVFMARTKTAVVTFVNQAKDAKSASDQQNRKVLVISAVSYKKAAESSRRFSLKNGDFEMDKVDNNTGVR